jgi:iron complex transport system substrate-binding protein
MLLRMYWSLCLVLCLVSAAPAFNVVDALGRALELPDTVERVICSGSGCLRLLTYLQAQDLAVAVDDIESKRNRFDSRPYALANPQFKTMPIFGQFRGQDNPELILTLEPQPQVIFKTFATMGYDPVELQAKTGIPVVVLDAGQSGTAAGAISTPPCASWARSWADLSGPRSLIAYFDAVIADLAARTAASPRPAGPRPTSAAWPTRGRTDSSPRSRLSAIFLFGCPQLAHEQGGAGKDVSNTNVAKEQIVAWDPDHLFVDLSTLQMGEGAGGLHELRTDPAYATLTAVREGRVFGVLPYNWYSQNYESILANAYFIGKVLYPERFADIDPAAKADEIYTFIVGKPVFQAMNRDLWQPGLHPADGALMHADHGHVPEEYRRYLAWKFWGRCSDPGCLGRLSGDGPVP